MSRINWFGVWQAGEAALRRCGKDAESEKAWAEIDALMRRRSLEPPDDFLRDAAAALDGLGSETARRYAQVCDTLADRFVDGSLSESALLDLTERMDTQQLPPQLRMLGKLLRSWGALQHAEGGQGGLLSLGLDLLEAPPEKRYTLAARLFVSRSPLADGGALERTAACLAEALLREIARQRGGFIG